jgi:Na+/melibiose symporter-like transporter
MLVTDEDEVTHGFRREGMFLGTNAFFIKFGDSVAAIIGTSVLIYFGFIRNAPSQPPEAIFSTSDYELLRIDLYIFFSITWKKFERNENKT